MRSQPCTFENFSIPQPFFPLWTPSALLFCAVKLRPKALGSRMLCSEWLITVGDCAKVYFFCPCASDGGPTSIKFEYSRTLSCQTQVSRLTFEPCAQRLRIVVAALRARRQKFCRHVALTDGFLQGLVPTMKTH